MSIWTDAVCIEGEELANTNPLKRKDVQISDDGAFPALQLVSAEATPSGVVIATYLPAEQSGSSNSQ